MNKRNNSDPYFESQTSVTPRSFSSTIKAIKNGSEVECVIEIRVRKNSDDQFTVFINTTGKPVRLRVNKDALVELIADKLEGNNE